MVKTRLLLPLFPLYAPQVEIMSTFLTATQFHFTFFFSARVSHGAIPKKACSGCSSGGVKMHDSPGLRGLLTWATLAIPREMPCTAPGSKGCLGYCGLAPDLG